ncbi:MAG: capsule biosynthesis protein [Acidithiobacillus ferriphilus]
MLQSVWTRIRNLNKLFLYVVIVPTALSIIYFGFLTSPVYISESAFVVYSPSQHVSSSGLASLLSGLGGSNSTSAAETIHEYVGSWDAMMALNKAYDLKKVYGGDNVDIFDRFGGVFFPHSSHVKLLRYYQSMVTDELDNTNGITKLKARAYGAVDARKINAFLLQKSQDIVNRLNERARAKGVYYAQKDVTTAEQKLRDATIALANYRNRHGVFSPPAQSALQLGMVSKLQDHLITQKTQLDAIRAHAPSNPQIPVLQSSIKALQGEIQTENAKVTGSKQSLASKDTEYERLSVNQLLAQKLLEAAVTSLEQARLTAQKQELYLETISRPNLPDAPQEPHRVEDILATLLISLLIWGVLSILVAGVREHHAR